MDERDIADKVLVILNVAGMQSYSPYFNKDTGEIENEYLIKMMKLLDFLDDADQEKLFKFLLRPMRAIDFLHPSLIKSGQVARCYIHTSDVRLALLFVTKRYQDAGSLISLVCDPPFIENYTSTYTLSRIVAQHNIVLLLREIAAHHPNWLPDNMLRAIINCLLNATTWLTGLAKSGEVGKRIRSGIDGRILEYGADVGRFIGETIEKLGEMRLENLDSVFSPLTPEMNQDRETVKQEINRYNFPPELSQAIDRIEANCRVPQDEFESADTIGQIRTFFENLVIAIAKEVVEQTKQPASAPLDGMGNARDYLRSNRVGFYGNPMNDVVAKLFGLFSNEGSHALTSDREMARICKNMALEMALYLFRRLQQFLSEKGLTMVDSPNEQYGG